MLSRLFVSGALMLLLGLLAGCRQKLDLERSLTVDVGDVQLIDIDPPRSEQKLTVTVTPSGAPVDVYVVAADDAEAAKQALLGNKKPSKPLASKLKVSKEETLEATIPAKTGYAVILGNASKESKVSVKLTGR